MALNESTSHEERRPTRVHIQDLVLRFGSAAPTLAGIDLSVPAGEVVALIGANGAGKSTLLRSIVRLVEPSSGTIELNGQDVRKASRHRLRHIRRDVGFVFQHFNLVNRASALDNVVHGGIAKQGARCVLPALAAREVREQAMDCLDRVGMATRAARRVDTLSGGQQQRVAIARALMQRPSLILADEPVASLDPVSGEGVMELLRSIARENGITVMSAIHHVDLAVKYSDRVVGLRDGRIALDVAAASCDPKDFSTIYTGAVPVMDEAA
ncbi:phosphonate ABC transporter ATP-binding protein [Microbacterium sp.]|uniref:phosphonate ABC transporter ATP-binding protein n=1 Tax=Microbacterium sp. TaxID=51671 RepID=UPI003C770B35